MSCHHPGMLQDGAVWTKLPHGARPCPALVGAGGFPCPPEAEQD